MDVDVVVEDVAQIVAKRVACELAMVWGGMVPNWDDFQTEIRNEVTETLMRGGDDPLGDAAVAVTAMLGAWADEGLIVYKKREEC